ncbi:MAG: type I-E CRISPR-associated protein Cas6/Cse3/CasE [Chlorobi bacterium CHB2]|nr:type I-E CRISPR-associated protein Cas6/Cse3/CasE [Chlorobi bacterium CHB2]
MNLSKLVLNPYSQAARRDISSSYELYRTLERAFPQGRSKDNRLLFRIEPPRPGNHEKGVTVLVQCARESPDWQHLPEADYCLEIEGPKDCSFVSEGANIFKADQHLLFRLIANPVQRIRKQQRSAPYPNKPEGHVRFRHKGILDEEEQHQWLRDQGGKGGFEPLFIQTVTFGVPRTKPSNVSHMQKQSIPHVGVRFEGLLRVTDPDKFIETLERGIGPAKAFGFGLMTVAHVV